MKKTFIIIFILVVVGAGTFLVFKRILQKTPVIENTINGIINSAIFSCADGKTIQSIFYKDKVQVTLDDGRTMVLPQVISASGARYANTDESFVFWNKGDTAFVEEGKQTTFKDCVIVNNTEKSTSVINSTSTQKVNSTIVETTNQKITGKEWKWIKTIESNGKITTPKVADTFSIAFKDDGSINGKTDCNGIFGKYLLNKNSLTFSSMAATLMYCENSQESDFTKSLSETIGYSFDKDKNLVLNLKSGSMIFK